MNQICEVHQLAQLDFQAAHALQTRLAGEIADEIRPATLLLLEHPHTFTFGRRGNESNLLWDEAELQARNVEVHWTDRGGDVTYHGPGQLVGYPLIPLGRLDSAGRLPQADYVGFLRKLEHTVIRALAMLGLAAGQRSGLTGVWVQPDVASRCSRCPPAAKKVPSKIASIGVRINSRGISQHGFAVNIAPQMEYWDGIVACDLPDAPMISLEDVLESTPEQTRVRQAMVDAFGAAFGFRMSEPRSPIKR
jgi:lipoate-protein ligase B